MNPPALANFECRFDVAWINCAHHAHFRHACHLNTIQS
jgi:hypothetical protein